MIDTIYLALTGLQGYQHGLKVIANNTANLNTPGFKSSSLLFADMYFSGGGLGGPGTSGFGQLGMGLSTLGTMLSFQQGQLQSTSNGLDLAVDGLGMFVLRDAQGNIHYTRDGQFKFNDDGILVTASTEEQVLALDANGALSPVSIANVRLNPAQATTTVTFGGNLSSAQTTATVTGVTIMDRTGSSHSLSVRFDAVTGTAGAWNVTLLDGTTTVGTGRIAFFNGRPDPAQSRVTLNYQLDGQDALPITLDFSENVTSYQSGTQNTLAMVRQDGRAPGALTGTTFDTTGTLVLNYSNGQTVRDVRLALARFDSTDAVSVVGDNRFEATDARAWLTGVAGDNGFGTIRSSMIEMSNVDLSSQFSDLVIMQRGYQASSQVVSTANEMLGELFGMKGK